MYDLLVQQQQQPDQRPHSSVGHYDGKSRRPHHKDPSSMLETSDRTDLLLLRDKEKVLASPSNLVSSKINEEPNEICGENDQVSKNKDDDVEIRSPSRKVSQDRPRLDKSQSTPTYELVMGDVNSFEEKLRDIRLRKQSRVEEEVLTSITENSNHSPSPSPISSSKFVSFRSFFSLSLSLVLFSEEAPPLSPKPALPPRNKVRPTVEEDPIGESASIHSSPTALMGSLDSGSNPYAILSSLPTMDNGTCQETGKSILKSPFVRLVWMRMPIVFLVFDWLEILDPIVTCCLLFPLLNVYLSQPTGLSSVLSNASPHELSHLGLRPHEIRDLIRRGLWPRHPTDEDRGIFSVVNTKN